VKILKVELSPKRVRAFLRGAPVVDTMAARLVWEQPYYPVYYLPAEHVRTDLLPADSYRAGEGDDVRGLLRVRWVALDAWFEEEDEVYVHPHDPYKRIDILHGSRHVVVSIGGVVLAETRRPTLLFETSLPTRYYIPKPDVRMELLTPIAKRTGCAYKGFASYYVYSVDGKVIEEDVAWTYAMPLADCIKIACLIAFYNETLDIEVDGKRLDKPITEFSRSDKKR